MTTKHFINSTLLSVLLIITAACNKNSVVEETTPNNSKTKIVVETSTHTTRASIGDKNNEGLYQVSWEINDKIGININNALDTFYLKSGNGTPVATFEGYVSQTSGDMIICYPYDAFKNGIDLTKQDGNNTKEMVMFAKTKFTKNPQVAFDNKTSILRFSINVPGDSGWDENTSGLTAVVKGVNSKGRLGIDGKWYLLNTPSINVDNLKVSKGKIPVNIVVIPGSKVTDLQITISDGTKHYTTSSYTNESATIPENTVVDISKLTLNNTNKTKYDQEEYQCIFESTKDKPIKIFIVGDGYTEADYEYGGKFDTDADHGINELFTVEPYKKYKDYFSVYKIAFFSEQEGISYINGAKKNTYFKINKQLPPGVQMQCGDNKAPDYEHVFSSIKRAMANKDVNKEPISVTDDDFKKGGCIVISNKNEYGGTCWTEASFTKDRHVAMVAVSDSPRKYERYAEVLIHEFGGHGFGRFTDEYITPGKTYPEDIKSTFNFHSFGRYLNVSLYEDKTPWDDLIGKEGYDHVKTYQGAIYCEFGAYRSEFRSCMYDNRRYFSSQCRKVIVKKIKTAAGETYSLDEFIKNDVQKTDNTILSY